MAINEMAMFPRVVSRSRIDYDTKGLNHELGFDTDDGGEQPMIAWEFLSYATWDTLQNYDFGPSNVPFKDERTLTATWIA